MMQVIIERCCGLDVHQETVVACLLIGLPGTRPIKEVRTFRTVTRDLEALRDWLRAAAHHHPEASEARRQQRQRCRLRHRRRGGLSSKIHTMVDALGNPLDFALTGGEAHDLVGADHLLPAMQAHTVIADKAFDAQERVIEPLIAAGKTVVIPPTANRKISRDYDRDLFKARHLIENFFARLKQFRAIATRYDKTARNFLAAIHLAGAVIWLN